MVAKATHSPLNIPLCRLNMSLVATNVDCCCKYSEGLELGCRSTQTDRQTDKTEDRWHTVTMTASPLTSTPGGVNTTQNADPATHTTGGEGPYQDGTCSRLPARLADNHARAETKPHETVPPKSKRNPTMHSCMRESGLTYGSGASISCLLHTAFIPSHDLE